MKEDSTRLTGVAELLAWKQKKRTPDPDLEVELELQKFELNARFDNLQAFLALAVGGFGLGLYFLAANEVQTHPDRALAGLIGVLVVLVLFFIMYGDEYSKIVEKYRAVLRRQQELHRARKA
jgi:hypothetical protein